MASIIGNHDAGSSLSTNLHLVQRFEKVFGASNRVTRFRGIELVAVNGIGLDRQSRHAARLQEQTIQFLRALPPKSSPRILLLHVPLYRENDLGCGSERTAEGGHVTYLSPEQKLQPFEDVLSQGASDFIMDHGK